MGSYLGAFLLNDNLSLDMDLLEILHVLSSLVRFVSHNEKNIKRVSS
jgi:hypothetical protein